MKHGSSIFCAKRLSIPHNEIFLQRGPAFPIRGYIREVLPKLLYRQRLLEDFSLCLFTIRVDKSILSTIEIRVLSRPKFSRNLSSDQLENMKALRNK